MQVDKSATQRLVYSREQAMELLGGISLRRIIELEDEGKLKPLTMTGKKTGMKFYSHDNLMDFIAFMHKPPKKDEQKKKITRRQLKAA